jgi:hypothetical protein
LLPQLDVPEQSVADSNCRQTTRRVRRQRREAAMAIAL